jgi:hypothetical protein
MRVSIFEFRLAVFCLLLSAFCLPGVAMLILAPPNMDRPGVIAGFTLSAGAGLTPTMAKGVLFAQEALYRPESAPVLPAADDDQQSWLHYNSGSGFYWSASIDPDTEGDASLGWVLAADGAIVALSAQQFEVPDTSPTVTVVNIGYALPPSGPPDSGDTGVPPAPGNFAAEAYDRDGVLHISALGFADFTNLHSVATGTLFLRYIDEIAGVHKILQWPIIDDHTDPITFYPAGGVAGLEIGDDLAIDSEDMRVTARDPGAGTVTCAREQLGSSMAEHLIGADIYRLEGVVATAPFPLGFFDDIGEPGAPVGSWKYNVELPCARVASIQFSLTNVFGDGPAKTNDYLGLCSDPYPVVGGRQGLRTNRGGDFVFRVPGVLGVGEPAEIPLPVPFATSLRDLYMWTETAGPTGADLIVRIRVNGAQYAVLTIADGETISDGLSGASLPALAADDSLDYEILQVGSTTPGEGLVIQLRY